MNGKKCNLVWYLDNTVSHMKEEVVDDSVKDLKNNFGYLVVTRWKKHTFWGMNINIPEDKKVEIDTKEQLFEAIEEFGDTFYEKVTTPASSHLFIVNEHAQQLD